MKFGRLGKRPEAGEGAPTKAAGNSKYIDFDLLYQLSYMSVIAAAGVPRSQIFERSSQLSNASSKYFRKIQLACRRLGYDYARACRVVGEQAKEEDIKGLLLRFSSSLVSGEPEAEFLTREAEALAKTYDNEYEGKLESLRQWTDAYVSLTLSAVLVVIIGLVSTMIWKMDTIFIMGLMAVCIGCTAVGVWLLYLMSPREVMVLGWDVQGGGVVRKVLKFLLPAAVVVCIVLLVRGANIGWILLIGAALVLPIGFVASRDDKKVSARDAEVGPFLRSLGGVCAAIGTTVRDALGRLDLESMNTLRPQVKNLHTRLISGIRARLCWQRFIEETGSELASRSVTMFYDAIDMGGEPERAGYHASIFANKIAMLRARRRVVSSPFHWLCIAMHGAVIMLLVFVTEVITVFGGMVAEAEEAMPQSPGAASMTSFASFNYSGIELMGRIVLPLVLIFTVANALAPSIVDGGSKWKFLYPLGITAAISGLSLIALPSVATWLFSSIQM